MIFEDRNKYVEDSHYFTEKDCPFCKNELENKKYLFHETAHWKIIHSQFPYYWSKVHLMAVPKRHIKFSIDLNNEELVDYKNIELFMKDYYKEEKNYYSFIRQSLWWRSVEHLHYHYLPWHISFDEKAEEKIFRIKNK